jgi:hypothetical protein
MKRFLGLCLAGWLVAGAAGAEPPEPKPAPLTREQEDKLKERDRYEKEAQKLRADGKLSEAIVAATKMLALERQVFGDVHAEVAGSLQFLGELYEAREEFASARKALQEVLAIQTKLLGEQHWQVTDARLALAHTELVARLDPKERALLQEATTLNRQVFQLWSAGQSRAALPLARQVVAIRRRLLWVSVTAPSRSACSTWLPSTRPLVSGRRPRPCTARPWRSASRCWAKATPTAP